VLAWLSVWSEVQDLASFEYDLQCLY